MADETKTPDTKDTTKDQAPSIVEQISESVLDELSGGMMDGGSHSKVEWSRSSG